MMYPTNFYHVVCTYAQNDRVTRRRWVQVYIGKLAEHERCLGRIGWAAWVIERNQRSYITLPRATCAAKVAELKALACEAPYFLREGKP